jgi:hypothetical protein
MIQVIVSKPNKQPLLTYGTVGVFCVCKTYLNAGATMGVTLFFLLVPLFETSFKSLVR